MGVLEELQEENKTLTKAFEKAVKFAASSCERCPYDSKLECKRLETFKEMNCELAVKLYFQGVKKYTW